MSLFQILQILKSSSGKIPTNELKSSWWLFFNVLQKNYADWTRLHFNVRHIFGLHASIASYTSILTYMVVSKVWDTHIETAALNLCPHHAVPAQALSEWHHSWSPPLFTATTSSSYSAKRHSWFLIFISLPFLSHGKSGFLTYAPCLTLLLLSERLSL